MNEYEQAKQVAENPYSYHELDVRDAKAFIRGYEAALRQPAVIKSVCDEQTVIKGIEDLMTAYQIWKVKQNEQTAL